MPEQIIETEIQGLDIFNNALPLSSMSEYFGDSAMAVPQTSYGLVTRITDIANWQNWPELDAGFRQGENGILVLSFNSMPDWMQSSAAWIEQTVSSWFGGDVNKWSLETLDGVLRARGVTLWSNSYWKGNDLHICFTTGIAPLVILGIVVGVIAAGVAMWALITAISAYKVSQEAIATQANTQSRITDASLDAISKLPEEEQAVALDSLAHNNAIAATGNTGSSGGKVNEAGTPSAWNSIAIIAGITVIGAVAAYAFLKGR